jgi:hypothetical protein
MPWIEVYNPASDSLSVTFKTHLNYIKCMSRLTNGLIINIHVSATARLDPNPIEKFESLSHITQVSIKGEKDACDKEKAYAQVASPWIPVKCYYYLYYLESVFLYLLSGSIVGFHHGGHYKVKHSILELLKNGQISLSCTHATSLAKVTDWATANGFNATIGSTISANYHNLSSCDDSLRKKIAEYIELDWKQQNRILNYRTLQARTKKTTELLPKEFCLLDYFYWMRIKANYRDIDFLDFDNAVNEDDAMAYLSFYIKATNQYANALTTAIASLKTTRGM